MDLCAVKFQLEVLLRLENGTSESAYRRPLGARTFALPVTVH